MPILKEGAAHEAESPLVGNNESLRYPSMMLCHPLECLYMPMMIPLGNESAKVKKQKKTRIDVLAQGTQYCLRDGVLGRRANRNLIRPETLDLLA